MKLSVKLPAVFTILLFTSVTAASQLKPGISGDLKKVLDDFPNRFANITGELIMQNPQSADYGCTLKIDGVEECFISKYSGKNRTISSWQALILTTEDFESAKKKFRTIYGQVNNLSWNSMKLTGNYEAPDEDKKFSSVIFSLDHAGEPLRKLIVELILEAEQMDWKVKLLVYDRDRDDNERGEIIE